MSFSARIKEELARVWSSRQCCRLSELSALIKTEGTIHIRDGQIGLHTSSETPVVARKILKLVKELFHIETELALSQHSYLGKRREHVIHFSPQPRLSQILNELGILDDHLLLIEGVPFRLVKSPCCLSAYLRGAFLGAGSISEPRQGYHLEFSTWNKVLAEDLKTLLKKCGLGGKINIRKKDFGIYLKGAEQIIDFLALVGAYHTLLSWENLRIIRQLRSETNRLVNCEMANLRRVTRAALEQTRAIKLVDEKLGLNNLLPSLKEVAEMRLKYPLASLSELGKAFKPPLSKSAVYHRLCRLNHLARNLNKY